MKKRENESWLHYFLRRVQDLLRDEADARYWANVSAMAGAACLAVAFIETSSSALYAGIICCLLGLKFHRKGNPKC